MKKLVLLLCCTLFLSACGHISGGVAPSNVPLAPGGYTELGPTRGTDCVYYLLGILPLTTGNTTREAVADAIASKPGADALVNVTADTYSQSWLLFSTICTQVEGVGVTVKK